MTESQAQFDRPEGEGQREDEASLPPVVFEPLDIDDEAEESPRPTPLPYRRKRARPQSEDGSREMMLGWCLWLLASWIMLGMGFNGTPIRQMIFASCIGMMIVWPAYRLSQNGRAEGTGIRGQETGDREQETACGCEVASEIKNQKSLLTPGLIFRDWFALNGVFQAVIWPHLMTKHWTLEQAGWVSASVAAWSLLIAVVVAWGCRSLTAIWRFAAMLLVLAILFAEPVALMVARDVLPRAAGNVAAINWSMHISPIEALYALTAPSTQFTSQGWALTVICVFFAAVLGWVGIVRSKRG